jgi:hypothetical protein
MIFESRLHSKANTNNIADGYVIAFFWQFSQEWIRISTIFKNCYNNSYSELTS